jgi:hypothetical protein
VAPDTPPFCCHQGAVSRIDLQAEEPPSHRISKATTNDLIFSSLS